MREEIHPCFAESCNSYGRIHLPVAPACNIQCNYCLRKFSCVNESRPGVVAKVMNTKTAVRWYQKMQARVPRLVVAGIAGPGDALANWQTTSATLRQLREVDDKVFFCLSTNGLLLPHYAAELVDLGVTYLTVTVNAVDPRVGALIYDYVDYQGVRYEGLQAAELLLSQQLKGIRLMNQLGVTIKINCVAIEDVNLEHIPQVARTVADLGCEVMNIIPMLPVAGSKFGDKQEISRERLQELRQECGQYLRQMCHCNRCRADAVGCLHQP